MLVCKFACKLTWVGVSLYVSLHVNLHPNLHTCNVFFTHFSRKKPEKYERHGACVGICDGNLM